MESSVNKVLGDKIPESNRKAEADDPGLSGLGSFTLGESRTLLETAVIVLVAAVIIGGAELLLRAFNVPHYIMPRPSQIFLADRVVVMSARPGRIAGVYDIDIPRPRPVEIQTKPDFIRRVLEIKARIDRGRSSTAGLAVA